MGFLFRRLFGKTSEIVPAQEARQQVGGVSPTQDEPSPIDQKAVVVDLRTGVSPSAQDDLPDTDDNMPGLEDFDGLDPTTRPVGMPLSAMRLVADGVTQPLAQETIIGPKSDFITFGQVSDVGLVRTNNQDAAYSFFAKSDSVDKRPGFGLFVIADGMGGHHDGEKAAAIAAKVVSSHVMTRIYTPFLTGDIDEDAPPLSETLLDAVQKANKEVIRQVTDGGTTTTAVIVVGGLAHFAHVGDSRAYLITQDGVEQITRDHSLVQRLIEIDQLTPEEATTHPQRNVLYRALGQTEALEVDIMTRRLPADSRLLLCSDGLWGLVDERSLFDIAMNTRDPQQACEKLVALANTQGGIDNITVILLNIN